MPAAGWRFVLAAGAGATVARTAAVLLGRRPPGGTALWSRTNHAGDAVSLHEGPAYVLGASAGAALAGRGPAALAALASGALGALDDLSVDCAGSKGLRGHLSALRRAELTTGAVKMAGLAATGLLSAALVDRRRALAPAARRVGVLDTLAGGAVVAGCANFVNLLDLRPGRALKVSVIGGLALADAPAAGAAVGAAFAVIGDDLGARTMLGDTGANAAGALLGAALVERCGGAGRLAALAVLSALTLASEWISFTSVIESTPGLRELDALGR